jgi:arylsulfatase A
MKLSLVPSVFAVLCVLSLVTSATAATKPNFIIINIDDLGYADIGPFGSKLNRTPHLDRMAAEGMKLKCHYAAPVCSPSRSSLMTGCYPKRVLPIPGVLFPAGAVGLHPDEKTVAEVLKDAGYATACIGKWHLGDQPEFLPTRQGFDHYFGIPYSNDMGPASEGSKSSLGDKMPEPKVANLTGNDEFGLRGNSQPPLPLLYDEKVIERVKEEGQQSITQRYTEDALKFIRANKDKNFFLYLPHTAVHFPIWPGKAFQHKSPHGIYSDWVEEVDWSVGQVLDIVRELKLESNTLVIFTSDNGGTPRSVNTPLRGAKASTWEGGMRVPTIAWWPGKIAGGSSTDAITSMMDVLPTFAALAGGKLPERKIDGADLWPLLSGKETKGPRDTFYFFRGPKLEAVRSGDWKIQFATVDAIKPNVKTKEQAKKAKNAAAKEPFPRLYNLATDVGETTNVAAQNPEIVAKLQALADATESDLGKNDFGPGCRELGRVKNPEPLIHLDGTIREGFAADKTKLP